MSLHGGWIRSLCPSRPLASDCIARTLPSASRHVMRELARMALRTWDRIAGTLSRWLILSNESRLMNTGKSRVQAA